MHVRQKIRQNISAMLQQCTTAKLVTHNREFSFNEEDLPAIKVRTEEEVVDEDSQVAGRCNQELINLTVYIETYVMQCEDAECLSDDLDVCIQKTIYSDKKIQGCACDTSYIGSTAEPSRADGELQLFVREHEFQVDYLIDLLDATSIPQ